MIEALSRNLPRLELYQQFQEHPLLQNALLNIFTAIVLFSLEVKRFYARRTLGK
jgi:hypothetical protein